MYKYHRINKSQSVTSLQSSVKMSIRNSPSNVLWILNGGGNSYSDPLTNNCTGVSLDTVEIIASQIAGDYVTDPDQVGIIIPATYPTYARLKIINRNPQGTGAGTPPGASIAVYLQNATTTPAAIIPPPSIVAAVVTTYNSVEVIYPGIPNQPPSIIQDVGPPPVIGTASAIIGMTNDEKLLSVDVDATPVTLAGVASLALNYNPATATLGIVGSGSPLIRSTFVTVDPITFLPTFTPDIGISVWLAGPPSAAGILPLQSTRPIAAVAITEKYQAAKAFIHAHDPTDNQHAVFTFYDVVNGVNAPTDFWMIVRFES